jgi:hypothetical protein
MKHVADRKVPRYRDEMSRGEGRPYPFVLPGLLNFLLCRARHTCTPYTHARVLVHKYHILQNSALFLSGSADPQQLTSSLKEGRCTRRRGRADGTLRDCNT